MSFYKTIENLLLKLDKFQDKEGKLLKSLVIDSAFKIDSDLIELLITNEQAKTKFFKEIAGFWVFNINDFILFIQDKNFLDDSYTRFKNKIGLNIDDKFLNQRKEVALVWPYKDCVLEGNQDKEDTKRQEIFFNEVLAQDEIDRLLDPKVLVNWTRHTANGEVKFSSVEEYPQSGGGVFDTQNNAETPSQSSTATPQEGNFFHRDENGTIKENLLIKGNNLLALHTLKKQFRNKVKLIYIDPPYNTGNDGFKYNDRFNHSTWLTFMKNRLEVAKELLRDDGVLFISIDDNEQAYLKILCDEIFGQNNFLSDIIWNSTKSVTNTAIVSVSHTHNLVYFKNKDYFVKNRNEFRLNEDGSGFSNPDNDPRGHWKADPFQVGGWRPNQQYEIENPKTGVIYKPNEGCSWKNDFIKFQELTNDNRIIFGVEGTAGPQRKRFLSEAEERGKVTKTIWDDVGTTTNGTQHLNQLLKRNLFSNPKPESLIKRMLELSTKENDIVLDFHAGSGTTGAVAHKMGRQWILVEQMDYIKDLPEARLKKVIGKSAKRKISEEERTGLQEILEKLESADNTL